MCHYGYDLNRGRGEDAMSLQDFYLRCARDDEFKATYAPFLDLEYVENEELQQAVEIR